jgi:hypothetical protein
MKAVEEEARHGGVGDGASATYGSTNWRCGTGFRTHGYRGPQGHMAAKTMLWIGMGKEA